VFRQRAQGWEHEGQRERLLQPERGRSVKVVVSAGSQTARVLRPDVREYKRPRHVAGEPAEQGHSVLGRTKPVSRVYRRHARPFGATEGLTGGGWRPRAPAGCCPGDVVLAGNGSMAAGGWFRQHVFRRRQLRARTESDTRSDSSSRAVRERVRRKRQHSGAGLPVAGFQRGPYRLLSVEGIRLVRNRHAQSEVWLSAHADD